MAERRRPQAQLRARVIGPLALCVAALAVAIAALFAGASPGAAGVEQLSNGGFETWTGSTPTGWSITGGSLAKETGDVVAGAAARVAPTGSLTSVLHAAQEVAPGDALNASVWGKGFGSGTIQVQLRFLDAGFAPTSTVSGAVLPMSGSFSQFSVPGAVAPPNAAWVRLVVVIEGSGEAILDSASLDIAAAPTPTATSEPPTATPTSAAEPPTATPATTLPTSPGGNSTATKTSTPTKTPTGTRTPSPTSVPTATKTPTPPKAPTVRTSTPLATSTPTIAPGIGYGGLLANGDFEVIREGKPAYWEKFGGTMIATGESARGSYAGCLVSETNSTKWLYQIVSVEAGSWYSASAQGRVAGGSASIRISWYESADGSGSQIHQDESNVSGASGWAVLDTGPRQAPDAARSARVRLVLQTSGNAEACFDDAAFAGAAAPAATAVPTSTAVPAPATPKPQASRTVPATAAPQGGTSASRPASVAVVSGPNTLRISEVMSDPSEPGRDAAFEWVELVNAGAEAVDLGGWTLADGTSGQKLPAQVVPPGGFVVVAGSGATMPAAILVVAAAGGEIGNGLGNTGDLLRLTAPDGAVVDEVSWGENAKVFDPPPPAPGDGQTLGVRDAAAEPASENWAITRQPTPGEPNEFAPAADSTVPGARPDSPTPDASIVAFANQTEVKEEDDDDSPAGWMILGGIAGISMGIAGAAFAPKARKWWDRRRGH